jgi:hypothetical protein
MKRWHYSGVCLCGHSYHSHHCCCVADPEVAKVIGDVVPDVCCAFGSNELEGRDEDGNDHCWGFCDKDNPDTEVIAKWRGTKR